MAKVECIYSERLHGEAARQSLKLMMNTTIPFKRENFCLLLQKQRRESKKGVRSKSQALNRW